MSRENGFKCNSVVPINAHDSAFQKKPQIFQVFASMMSIKLSSKLSKLFNENDRAMSFRFLNYI